VKRKRIESTTSRTAEMTCLSRAVSSQETNSRLRSDDHLAVTLLPALFRALVHIPLFRWFHRHVFAPAGIYEYVVARTKYIDGVFKRAMLERFDQVLLLGAGFDTRALRFQAEAQHARIFELDAYPTQQAKIRQYRKRGLSFPSNLTFIEVDFDKDSLPEKLDISGFQRGRRSLFVLEGLLMYLESESVSATLQTVQEYAGVGSWVVFDYVRALVLRHENSQYGEARLRETVARVGEQWRYGIDPSKVASLLATFGFTVIDHKDAKELEDMYFRNEAGRLAGRVNATHCIALAVRQ
jgi:methyltransferase (TIGR00027 family)